MYLQLAFRATATAAASHCRLCARSRSNSLNNFARLRSPTTRTIVYTKLAHRLSVALELELELARALNIESSHFKVQS